jgi:hypothetical protein
VTTNPPIVRISILLLSDSKVMTYLMIIEKLQTDRNIVMTFQMSLIWNWYRFWLECNWFCGSYNVTTTGTCIVGPQKLN